MFIKKLGFRVACIGAVLAFNGALACAADYPNRPVHLIVGYSAGGGSDLTTRLVGKALSEKWHQPVIVENKPGADGTIGAAFVAQAAPDGYTLIMVTGSHTFPPVGYTIPYDPLKNFAPITMAVSKPQVLFVNASVPVNSLKELIALAKAKPGVLNFASSGRSTPPFLQMALFMQQAGISMTDVTYKGEGDSLVALVGGEVQALIATYLAGGEFMKAGKIKALGVTTDKRSSVMPDVPTIAEAASLPGFNEVTWNGLLAPAGTPAGIVKQIHDDYAEVSKGPEFQQAITTQGMSAVGNTPEQFASYLASEVTKYQALYKTFDIK